MEELDLKELFLIFWNKRVEIVLIVLMLVIVGVLYSYVLLEPKYSSSTTLVLVTSQNETTDTTITQTDITLNSKLISTYSELIKNKSVLREVIENLNIEGLTEENVKNNVNVKAVTDTELIKITVTDADPNIAAEVANEIAKVFSNKIIEIYNISNVYILDRAEASQIPSNINHIKDLVIFAFIGAVIAIIYVLIANMMDNTIKNEEDIEKTTGLFVLSSIPNYEVNNKRGRRSRRL